MSLILGIESSTTTGSIALVKDGVTIGLQSYHIDKSHSSLLHPMIDQLVRNAGVDLSELDAIALAMGPGSYTGLRIGTSTAKGLCFSLDIPLVAVNTLLCMAHQVSRYNDRVDYLCPMIDARRMEVYAMVLDKNLDVIRETMPVILESESFEEQLKKGTVLFFGDGSNKFQNMVSSEHALFLNDLVPSAQDVALLGEGLFEKGLFENVIDFEPFYLKEFRTTTPKKV